MLGLTRIKNLEQEEQKRLNSIASRKMMLRELVDADKYRTDSCIKDDDRLRYDIRQLIIGFDKVLRKIECREDNLDYIKENVDYIVRLKREYPLKK